MGHNRDTSHTIFILLIVGCEIYGYELSLSHTHACIYVYVIDIYKYLGISRKCKYGQINILVEFLVCDHVQAEHISLRYTR
jgi:hypothetical protein